MLDPTNDSDARDLAEAAFSALLPHPEAWPVGIAVVRLPESGKLRPVLNFEVSVEPTWFEFNLKDASLEIGGHGSGNPRPDVVETVASSPYLQRMIECARSINDRTTICDFHLREPTAHEIAEVAAAAPRA